MIKLVIFDLDGTLLNTLDDLANACNYILTKHNFPTHPTDDYKHFVGGGMRNLVKNALQKKDIEPDAFENILEEFITYYTSHSDIKTVPYPGIVELLNTLADRGIKLAIASNKIDSATKVLSKKYFEGIFFDIVLGQREGVPTKPNPQIAYDIIDCVGISDKADVLYIGDTDTDMQTAVNANITAIGALWGFRTADELKGNGAGYLAQIPSDILQIIETLDER